MCVVRKQNTALQNEKIVISLSRLDGSSANCEDTRLRGPVGLRNPFAPKKITRPGIHPVIFLHAFLLFGSGDLLTPDPPELQILVAGTSYNHVAGRSEGAEQDTRFVSVSNLCHAFEGGIGVDHDRVGRIAVGGQDLLSVG